MKSVLVLDDDQDVREVIVYALENDGLSVLSAENGRAGLEILKGLSVDALPGVMIVDNFMPEMDGVTFIREVKERYPETLGKIPVIYSSAMGAIDQDNPYLKDVVTLFKPMELEDLLKIVRKFCA